MKHLKLLLPLLVLAASTAHATPYTFRAPARGVRPYIAPADLGTFHFTGALQNYTVPTSGTYTIEATGARGGDSAYSGYPGGNGAKITCSVFLAQGTVLKILVGEHPVATGYAGGGGGGSFVTSSTNSALCVGGGGSGASGFGDIPGKGSTALNGTGQGGTGGDTYGSPGGGGMTTDGGGGGFASGGSSFVNGGAGGVNTRANSGTGGFGGGGGGSSGNGGGGGGGGYSGGKGVAGNSLATGDAGTSYSAGTMVSLVPSVNAGHGLVRITAQ